MRELAQTVDRRSCESECDRFKKSRFVGDGELAMGLLGSFARVVPVNPAGDVVGVTVNVSSICTTGEYDGWEGEGAKMVVSVGVDDDDAAEEEEEAELETTSSD